MAPATRETITVTESSQVLDEMSQAEFNRLAEEAIQKLYYLAPSCSSIGSRESGCVDSEINITSVSRRCETPAATHIDPSLLNWIQPSADTSAKQSDSRTPSDASFYTEVLTPRSMTPISHIWLKSAGRGRLSAETTRSPSRGVTDNINVSRDEASRDAVDGLPSEQADTKVGPLRRFKDLCYDPDENVWAMKKIVGHKALKSKEPGKVSLRFLTTWVGYDDPESDTWEPVSSFLGDGAKRLLTEYRKSHSLNGSKKPSRGTKHLCGTEGSGCSFLRRS
ncbi:hypothetical protein AAFC00_005495 [Neodothiora populina]|uniref:Chromo domain-containing protein n=1 Tax=Neodothiora populina TaxID=2781224 RepID=A0ABR3PL26_9PEZI